MIKVIHQIILSYIRKFNTVDFIEIQQVVSEPVTLLVDELKWLYKNEYYFKGNDSKLYITEKATNEFIYEWNTWIETEWIGDSFDVSINNKIEKMDNGCPIIKSVSDLKNILKLYQMDMHSYHQFDIENKGKIRTITAPSVKLKVRQKWILNNILYMVELPDCVHGFAKGKSIKTNALCHVNKKEIGCLDIQDFFQNVNQKMVYNVFKTLGYSNEVSDVLSELCTFGGILPQGAPTSPMLANIIMKPFDLEMIEYATQRNIVYSRYADDITISGNKDIKENLQYAKKLLRKYGFKSNNEKEHIMKDNYRKLVTGLVVTDVVKVPKQYKRKLRSEIYYCNKFGVAQHLKNIGRESAVNFKEYMYGKAYYIRMIEPDIGEQYLKQIDEIFENACY